MIIEILLVVAIILLILIIFGGVFLFREKNKEQENLLKQFTLKENLIDEKINNKKDYIKNLVDQISKEIDKNQKQIETAEKERTGEFSSLKTIIEEHKNLTGQLKESTDNLKNLLSNNQLRGRYGEEVAENLLKSAGFVKGENYVVNLSQDTVNTRPDFTIFLPDKTKINIDAKFPLKALIKYEETKDDKFLKEFDADVKAKIKQVSTRDYINPEENTVDFVILFIPNEMIFSFIYDKLNDTWNDAMKKKVILAGPFSFTAILRMVFQSYSNFKYQENLHEIVKLFKVFEMEYEKYNEKLNKLGNQIETVSKTYTEVATTRDRKLNKVVEKIKGENEFKELK